MDGKAIIFGGHAIRRMFERRISPSDVRHLIEAGEIIASYPDDRPFPSRLMLGFVGHPPLHVVVAHDRAAATCHVVTVYVPDPEVWHPDYRTRRSS